MKSLKKLYTMGLAALMVCSMPFAAFAAEPEDSVLIDATKKGSMTIYKYDLTNAEKDGVWDSSYVSTGVMDQAGVVDKLGGNRAGDNDNESVQGNSSNSYGYAIKGVEFTYSKVADIVQFSESEADSRTDDHVEVLYAIDKTAGSNFLKAIGLTDGKDRYTNADAKMPMIPPSFFISPMCWLMHWLQA